MCTNKTGLTQMILIVVLSRTFCVLQNRTPALQWSAFKSATYVHECRFNSLNASSALRSSHAVLCLRDSFSVEFIFLNTPGTTVGPPTTTVGILHYTPCTGYATAQASFPYNYLQPALNIARVGNDNGATYREARFLFRST